MATLSSKERKELPDGVFGLPKDRSYPLTDEAHVRKAIQYFKFCDPAKRNELSKNINARAKELGMTLKISKDSTFYKYADKNIVKESAYDDFEFQRLIEIGHDEIIKFTKLIKGELQTAITTTLDRLLISASIDHFATIEKQVQVLIRGNHSFTRTFERLGYDHQINPLVHVNRAMDKAYNVLFGFLQYNYPGYDLTVHKLIHNIFEDIFFYMKDVVMGCKCKSKIEEKLKLIDDLMSHYSCNAFYVYRKLREIGIQVMIELRGMMKEPLTEEVQETDRKLLAIHNLLSEYSRTIISKCNTPFDPMNMIQNKNLIFDTLRTSDMNFINGTEYLKVIKNELKSQVDIILLERDMNIRDEVFNNARFTLTDVVDRDHGEILTILGLLEGSIRKGNITLYNRDYSLCLCSADIVAFTELEKFERLYIGKDNNGEDVYYGLNKNALYLLGKTNVLGELVIIDLYENSKTCLPIKNLICPPDKFDRKSIMSAVRIRIGRCTEMQSVTEGIAFDEDGSFKFSFKPKKTYMDEYSENHKVLVQNFKSKNYLGMKTNLAFLFELINNIERKQHSQKTFASEIKRDMEKARMFAINDFKTYLKEVQKIEPGFDFTTYYQNTDYGKVTIGVNKKDIIGMKRLFQTIILS